MRRAYRSIDPASVGWVIGHATGTRAGDSTELTGLHEVAGTGPPALLSSNKSIVGHTGWTAGLVSLVQALAGLRRGAVPAQRYLREPLEGLRGSRFTPPLRHTTLPLGTNVGVSSFGFGGTNAHLVLGDLGSPGEISNEDVVVVGWSADLPGGDATAWLCGTGPEPPASFGAEYPMPSFEEVRLPPASLRTMDRTQIMLLNAAARLPEHVRDACAALHDTAGVVVGHMGPTSRAVHYALRCYLGDLEKCLGELPADLVAEVKSLAPASTEDSFPGIMPNVIAARLAALWDLHGLNVTIDTGPESSRDALRCAERYLRHGDLDVAVVAGLNGNTTPEFAQVLGEERALAEGCFTVVLMRESTAKEHSLPVLGRELSCEPVRSGRTYFGADHLLALLRRLVRREPSVERVVRRLLPTPATAIRPALPAIPEHALVLTADTVVVAPESARVVVVPQAADEETLAALLPASGITHVRVVADVTAADEAGTLERLRTLHDLSLLAAARWTAGAGSSFGVALTGAVRGGAPHPATGMFTGLIKSLAREEPDALSFAVLTDESDALPLLAGESACAPELFVAVHNAGTRYEYDLVAAEPAACPDQLGVVVAAGGTRGLTAEVLAALAARYAPAVYLLGRQAPAAEDLSMSRAEYIKRESGPHRTVAQLSAQYDAMRASAETGRTMRRLAEICGQGRVHHIVCDLTDTTAVRSAIDRIHQEQDRVDLLINAAGIHHGGTVRATPLPIARQVRDTKVLTYANLLHAFADRPPARWCNFGSLLSVLGWPGEAAYCAGNDVLLAGAAWHRRTGVRETTIAWPLWDTSGFAAEPVTRDLLRARGALTAVSDEQGAAMFLAELGCGDAEVTFLGTAERRMLHGEEPFRWTPDPQRDGHLRHHLLGGVPTLPGALIVELAVRAARGHSPVVVKDVRFHAPVSAPPGKPVSYRLPVDGTSVRVLSDVVAPNGTLLRKDRLHAEATVLPGSAIPLAARVTVPIPRGRPATPGYYIEGSRVELSGPFASLTDVRIGHGTATARFTPDLGGFGAFAELCVPALLLDALFQLTVLARCGDGPVPVPLGVDVVGLFTEHNDVELLRRYGDAITLMAGEGPSAALAPDGTVLIRVSGVRWHGQGAGRVELAVQTTFD
ncbi:hypothetical protein GCM10022267_31280 [Lentzea roselyniae]|uniref:Uncharacterized protein n=1 Tax=Lentzea roselyniae TaxID=531940 RepID=A0ABP7AXV3_9PSEU